MKVPCLNASRIARMAIFSCALVTSLLVGGAAHAQSQATDGVRVIDIKYIFEHHTRFKGAMEGLKKEFDASAQRVQAERNAINQLIQQLKEMNNTSPDYKRMDEDIARRQAEWKLQGDKQLKEFRTKESEILWNVYYEIQLAVKEYSRVNNVGLVIQFNGDPIDSRNPKSVVSGIGRQIVFVAPNRDITPHILAMMEKGPPVDVSRRQPISVPDAR
ncbi:MAG: OmpH family outer membrane protein [Planctomycetes bacterium]|nr:OmpH family outer membrane protein [Planctomycetota bacterium]